MRHIRRLLTCHHVLFKLVAPAAHSFLPRGLSFPLRQFLISVEGAHVNSVPAENPGGGGGALKTALLRNYHGQMSIYE